MHMVSTNWSGQYCQLDFRGETLRLIVWNDTSLVLDTPRPYSYFRGKWTKLQTGIQCSTKSVQVWVDDVKVYDHTNVGNYSRNNQVNQINIRAHQIDTTNSMTWYIDDVSVDRALVQLPAELQSLTPRFCYRKHRAIKYFGYKSLS